MLCGSQNIALPALYRAYELRHMPYAISSAIFTVPPAAIRGSLIHGLGNFGRSAECVEVGAAMLGLPASPAARAYIVIFAVVEWTSAEKIAGLEELEKVGCCCCCCYLCLLMYIFLLIIVSFFVSCRVVLCWLTWFLFV